MMTPRIGAYLRCSTSDQSTELQRRELEAYSNARDWATVTYYEDKASGTSTMTRTSFKQLMADARARRLDVVLVWKLDRFFRSLKDMVVTLQELSELGVQFISIKDQLDLTTSSGRLMSHILGAFAEFEASLIRERVRAGLANAKAKGKRLGRKPSINAEAVVQLRSQGLSLSEIAARVNSTKSGVHKTLQRMAYPKSSLNRGQEENSKHGEA